MKEKIIYETAENNNIRARLICYGEMAKRMEEERRKKEKEEKENGK